MPIWKIKTQIAQKIPNYTIVHLEGQKSLIKELDTTLENSQWELQDDILKYFIWSFSHIMNLQTQLILRENFEILVNFAI